MDSKNRPKILIIEDEPDACNSLQSYLGRRGFLVSATSDGKEGLSILKAVKPDLVLLDLLLPSISGKEVLRTLRGYDKDTKVIVITGELLKDYEIAEIKSLGISEYLNKPIELEKLLIIINKILGRKISFPKVVAKTCKSSKTKDDSARAVVHELSNLMGIIRTKCENFTLNMEEGIYNNKTDKELVKLAIEIMSITIKTVDEATEVIQKVSGLIKR